jgi:hypothetical protein
VYETSAYSRFTSLSLATHRQPTSRAQTRTAGCMPSIWVSRTLEVQVLRTWVFRESGHKFGLAPRSTHRRNMNLG